MKIFSYERDLIDFAGTEIHILYYASVIIGVLVLGNVFSEHSMVLQKKCFFFGGSQSWHSIC